MKSEQAIPEGYHWIANNPRSIRGIKKREGVEYHQGPPKPTEYSEKYRHVGLYVNMSREEYMRRPLTGERI